VKEINGAELDPQPFHLDEEAARDTIFGGLAASGWHTAAVTMRLLVESDLTPARGQWTAFAHGMPCRLMCAVFPPASSPGPTRRSQSARGSHALTFDFLAAETVHSQHFVSAMDTAELPAFPTAGLHGITQYSRSWG